jgi:hypothetical protein
MFCLTVFETNNSLFNLEVNRKINFQMSLGFELYLGF